MKETIAQHATTTLIADRLRQVKEKETISYTDLAAAVAVRSVQSGMDKRSYCSLQTARRRILEDGFFFEVIPDVGLRRLCPAEIARGEGRKSIDKIKRVAKKGMKVVRIALTSDSLGKEDKVRANTDTAVLGALILFTDPLKAKKIEQAVRDGQMKVSIGTTLQLFKKDDEEKK
jgi:hypothetical protein